MASAAAAASTAPAGAILLAAADLQEVWDSLLGNEAFFEALYLSPKLSVKTTPGGGGGGVKTPSQRPGQQTKPKPVSRPTTGQNPQKGTTLIAAEQFRNDHILQGLSDGRKNDLNQKWDDKKENPFENWSFAQIFFDKDQFVGKGAEACMSKDSGKYVKLKTEYYGLREKMDTDDDNVAQSFRFYLPQWHDAFSMLTKQDGEWRIDPAKTNGYTGDGDGGGGDGGDDLTPVKNARNAQNAPANGTSQTIVRAELEATFKVNEW